MTTAPRPVLQPSPERPPANYPARADATPAPSSLTPPAIAQPPDWKSSGIDPKVMYDFERDLGQAENPIARGEPHIRWTQAVTGAGRPGFMRPLDEALYTGASGKADVYAAPAH